MDKANSMYKEGSMQEQMGNISGEMEILRKKQKEILELKNTLMEMNDVFDELLVVWTWLKKEFLSLISQWQPLKLKSKEKK